MRTFLLPLAVLVALAVLPGCKPKAAAETETTPPPAKEAVVTPPDDGKDPGKASVTIDPRIVALCDIGVPGFSYNSTQLSASAKSTLDKLAKCFIGGPAMGKNLRLVGHADPRGDEEYNFGLGQRRADNVAGYLDKQGLGSSRVETSSRGKLDATGTDEASWANDRKVQILLAE